MLGNTLRDICSTDYLCHPQFSFSGNFPAGCWGFLATGGCSLYNAFIAVHSLLYFILICVIALLYGCLALNLKAVGLKNLKIILLREILTQVWELHMRTLWESIPQNEIGMDLLWGLLVRTGGGRVADLRG